MRISEALQEFREAMVTKLEATDHKHGARSALRIAAGHDMDLASLQQHMILEFQEWSEEPDSQVEMVDIANMAFLLWWHQQDCNLASRE